MPRPSHLNPDDILRFLQVTPSPAAANEISRSLDLKKSEQRAPLQNARQAQKSAAPSTNSHGGRYRLAGRKADRSASGPGPSAPFAGNTSQNRGSDRETINRDEVRGRLVLHHDGYGFVVPDQPIPELDGDIFIPRLAIEDAMHGDHVVAKFQRRSGHSDRQRAEGRIIRVLDRAHPSVVGLFRYGPRYNVVLPYDARLQHEIEIPPGEELTPALREKTL